MSGSGGEEEEEYEADRIIAKKIRRGNPMYLVRWKGCGEEEDSWEPLAHLCSRHREGGGGRNLRVPPCFVPCRAVPPMGGGGWQRGLVPCHAKCSYPTRAFVEAHMYQWFRFGRHVALFRDCCICNFLCVVSWCCTMCFPTHS